MNYNEAYRAAEKNQNGILKALPIRLIKQENDFLEKIIGLKVAPLKKLEILYSFMSELSSFTSRFTPCQKGCSACCHYKVSVSLIEVEYIEKRTKYRRNKMVGPVGSFHGKPCPFLENGSCSIYEVRPFMCRRHHVLTPDASWCEPNISNNKSFPQLGFTNVDGAFGIIRLESNTKDLYDIRQLFGAT